LAWKGRAKFEPAKEDVKLAWMIENFETGTLLSRRKVAKHADELEDIKRSLMDGLPKVMGLDFRTWFDNLEGLDRSLDELIRMGKLQGYYDKMTKAELGTAKWYKEKLEKAFDAQHPPGGEEENEGKSEGKSD